MFVSLSHSNINKYSTSMKELFTVLYNDNIGCEFTLFDNKGKKNLVAAVGDTFCF
jgi:hypothetical protein